MNLMYRGTKINPMSACHNVPAKLAAMFPLSETGKLCAIVAGPFVMRVSVPDTGGSRLLAEEGVERTDNPAAGFSVTVGIVCPAHSEICLPVRQKPLNVMYNPPGRRADKPDGPRL